MVEQSSSSPICKTCGAPIWLVQNVVDEPIPFAEWAHIDAVDILACPGEESPVPDEEASP